MAPLTFVRTLAKRVRLTTRCPLPGAPHQCAGSQEQERCVLTPDVWASRFSVRRPAQTTGLVGIAVNPQARTALIDLYQKTLQALSELPESAEYRQATEKLTRRRLEIVQKETDHEAIERYAKTVRAVRCCRSTGPLMRAGSRTRVDMACAAKSTADTLRNSSCRRRPSWAWSER